MRTSPPGSTGKYFPILLKLYKKAFLQPMAADETDLGDGLTENIKYFSPRVNKDHLSEEKHHFYSRIEQDFKEKNSKIYCIF